MSLNHEGIPFEKANKERIEHLKRKIFRAFYGLEKPGKDELIGHFCEECFGLRDDFAGLVWTDVSGELLEKNFGNLALFSAAAFHYYLPAYMLYALDRFDSDVAESVCIHLTANVKNGEKLSEYHLERYSRFDLAQMNTIFELLELMREHPAFEYYLTSIERSFERLKRIFNELIYYK